MISSPVLLEVSPRSLLRLAVPAALSVLLNNAYRGVDQYVVQWIGPDAQAAIGSSTFVLIFFFSLFSLVSVGVGPLVARTVGAQDFESLRRILGHGLIAAVIVAICVWTMAGLGAELVVSLVGLQGESAELMTIYLRSLAWVGLPLALGPLVDAAFIAMGEVRLPMVLHFVATVINGILSWVFIYPLGMGIAGAAFASGVSRGLAVVIGGWILARRTGMTPGDLKVQVDTCVREWLRILRIGFPIAANTAAYALVYWALLRVAISPLGPAVNAALGIGFSALEGVAWPVFHGVALASASMAGRALGAGRVDLAEKVVIAGIPMALFCGFSAAFSFYFGAEYLCGLFTDDPETFKQAVLYARILAFSQVFVALEALFEGVLAGAGDTKTVFWWSTPINVFRVPLGWLAAFPLGFGAAGIWWVINLTTVLKGMGKMRAVLLGGWKRIEV